MTTCCTDDGINISYDVLGDGPCSLLLMHGWGGAGSGHSWKQLIKYLNQTGLRILIPDLRGHGKSDKAQGGFTTERFARDMFAVADDARADKFVVVGYSMSGKWAQWMACAEPDRVIGQILIAPAPASQLPLSDEILEQWLKAAQHRSKWEQVGRQFTKEPLKAEIVDEYFADVSTTPPLTLVGTYNMCRTGTFIDQLKATQAATLVIGGIHDPMLPPDFLRQEIVARIAGAHLILLDCGHEIPLEMPQESAMLIEAFLAGLRC